MPPCSSYQKRFLTDRYPPHFALTVAMSLFDIVYRIACSSCDRITDASHPRNTVVFLGIECLLVHLPQEIGPQSYLSSKQL